MKIGELIFIIIVVGILAVLVINKGRSENPEYKKKLESAVVDTTKSIDTTKVFRQSN